MDQRVDLVGFDIAGIVRLEASVDGPGGTMTAIKDIGNAMGRSVETIPGAQGFREGFFDNLLEMGRMPISGMVMTYASERLIPDSANTATAWSTGNKTFEGGGGAPG